MPRAKGPKGTKLTAKAAKKAIRMTLDGWRRLILCKMGITVFPKCLLKMTKVDELDLSRNLIQRVPDGIGNLLSLRWLDLHSNKLESVPESIGNLLGLTFLNLANNRLTSAGLPSTLGSLTNLKSLNLGMNQLDALPPTMVNLDSLQELGLFDNLFTNLPDFLKTLPNLTKVNVKRNPLSYIEEECRVMLREKDEEEMHLIHESNLCKPCLRRCKEQKERVRKGGGPGGGGELYEERRIRTYPGLTTPNSAAAVNQDAWRIRRIEHKPLH